MLSLLESYTMFTCESPAAERCKLHTVQAVMEAFPRSAWSSMPKNNACADCLVKTLKALVAVNPQGSFDRRSRLHA